jgi:hypothetical protein
MTFGVPQQLFVPLASDLAMDGWMDQLRSRCVSSLAPLFVRFRVPIGRHRDLLLSSAHTSMTVESRAM